MPSRTVRGGSPCGPGRRPPRARPPVLETGGLRGGEARRGAGAPRHRTRTACGPVGGNSARFTPSSAPRAGWSPPPLATSSAGRVGAPPPTRCRRSRGGCGPAVAVEEAALQLAVGAPLQKLTPWRQSWMMRLMYSQSVPPWTFRPPRGESSRRTAQATRGRKHGYGAGRHMTAPKRRSAIRVFSARGGPLWALPLIPPAVPTAQASGRPAVAVRCC
jgi:hypothetical protein